jgi:hypothetical protein
MDTIEKLMAEPGLFEKFSPHAADAPTPTAQTSH